MLALIFLVFLVIPLPDYLGLYNWGRMFPYYVMGYYISINRKKIKFPMIVIFSVMWVISILLVVVSGRHYIITEALVRKNFIFEFANKLIQFAIAGSWIFVLFQIAELFKTKENWVSEFGRYSLDLYVLQGGFVVLLRKIQLFLEESCVVVDISFVVLFTIFSVFIMYMVSKYIVRKNKYSAFFLLGRGAVFYNIKDKNKDLKDTIAISDIHRK